VKGLQPGFDYPGQKLTKQLNDKDIHNHSATPGIPTALNWWAVGSRP
jgi:hypothetical protein